MPDVARSQSLRASTDETSDRHNDGSADSGGGTKVPRSVSFNRDVRIKRIGPRETSRPVPALTSNGIPGNKLVVLPVRREKLGHLSREELAEEAARVLKQAERVSCVSADNGVVPEKFYSLPVRGKKHKRNRSPSSTLGRRRSEEIVGFTTPITGPGPKKPPRTFLSRSVSVPKRPSRNNKNTLANLFKTEPGLKRTKSDTSQALRKRSGSESSSGTIKNNKKPTQLSPIIEVSPPVFEPADDYFDSKKQEIQQAPKRRKPKKAAEIIVIDLEKAEKISSSKPKRSLKETLKSFTRRIDKQKPAADSDKENRRSNINDEISEIVRELEETVKQVEESDRMIHSSPKMPMSRGTNRVDDMVRRLSRDKFSPPPKSHTVLVAPTIGMQHNNNKPFSYTKPSSPERFRNSLSPERDTGSPKKYTYGGDRDYLRADSPEIGIGGVYHRSPSPRPNGDHNQVIYAQVVCGTSSDAKKTIHKSYGTKKFPHNSDSDEGLGYEEHPKSKWNNDESPIKPTYLKYARTFSDIRGRGDGMDSKRRDSITENGISKRQYVEDFLNGSRNDLSSRREQLESRINSRTLQRNNKNNSEVFRTETSSSYYRNGGHGYAENYASESRGRDGLMHTTETRSREVFGDDRKSPDHKYERSYKTSRATKYITQNEKLVRSKEKEHHRSNPELIVRNEAAIEDGFGSYHDSLKRQKHDMVKRRLFEQQDSMRSKDKFVDSGIENDFRRDSGENVRVVVQSKSGGVCHESEDEGFASSLLIASERQHTEDNADRRRNRYDEYEERDLKRDYRNIERMDYKVQKNSNKTEYVPRERSIDDGSHFDPRIDKDVDTTTMTRKVEKKPPKPEKKISGLDKVKNLFSSKKTKEKRRAAALEQELMVKEEEMRARYSEYKGSTEQLDKSDLDYSARKRLATPRSSPTPTSQRKLAKESKSSALNVTQSTKESNGWFKSLDRLGRRNKDKPASRPPSSKITDKTVSEDENYTRHYQPNHKTKKNLRFFGDTDIESDASLRYKTSLRHRPSLNSDHKRSYSHRDLHNIEETQHEPRQEPDRRRHKSLQSFDTVDAGDDKTSRRKYKDDDDASRLSMKPPISPVKRDATLKRNENGARRINKKNDVSSVESSTEGDSSQQSQKSVVYLHAATVGDIPSPGDRFARTRSREEINSIASSKIQPRKKTLSRSFSVLAPWTPKYQKDKVDIDYSQQPRTRSTGRTSSVKTKIEKNRAKEDTNSTLKRHKSSQSLSKSKENISRRRDEESVKGSNSTLFRKQKDKKQLAGGEKKKPLDTKKSMSLESLGSGSKTLRSRTTKKHDERVSRSKSMPKDTDRPAGWFKKSKGTGEPGRG